MDLLKLHYPEAKGPGGILTIKKDGDINTIVHGLAHLEENTSLTPQTRFRMASVSKQFTAMAIYQLIQDNKISFETPVRTILPELHSVCNPIQMKHLINHSSGLMDYENLISPNQKSQLSDEDVFDIIKNQDSLYFKPGAQFRYSNTAYCLMSLIVERIAKVSYEQYCDEKIFKELNMTSAQISAPQTMANRAFGYRPKNQEFAFADQSITSATRGDGGVYISSQDYLKWADKGNVLFTADYFKDLEQYAIPVKENVYYSLGWFYTKSDRGNLTLFHSGESTGFHNIVVFQPTHNNAYFLFTNRDDLIISKIFDQIMKKQKVDFPKLSDPLFIWLSKVYAGQ